MSHDRLSDQIAERLMSQITSGQIAPGERLPGERQLAQQLGVSRVSVRSALQSLKTRGLLEAVQGGGTRVVSSAGSLESPMTTMAKGNFDNLRDLAEIRLNLETWAARKAAENATAEDIASLEKIVAQMARGLSRASSDDIDFHMTLAKASGSAIYAHIVDVIREALAGAVRFHRDELYTSPEESATLLDHHRAIFAAVQKRDGNAAAEAMQKHLAWVIGRYDSHLTAT